MSDCVNMGNCATVIVLFHFYQLILAPLRLNVQQRCHFRNDVTSSRTGGACVFSQPIFYLQPSFIYLFIYPSPSMPPPLPALHQPASSLRPALRSGGLSHLRDATDARGHRTQHRAGPARVPHTHNRATEQKPVGR